MRCEHCHQPIPDGEPIYRAHARYRSYGRGLSGSVCTKCSGTQPRRWHPPAPCIGCTRLVIYDADRKLPKYILCGSPRCRQVAYGELNPRRRAACRESAATRPLAPPARQPSPAADPRGPYYARSSSYAGAGRDPAGTGFLGEMAFAGSVLQREQA